MTTTDPSPSTSLTHDIVKTLVQSSSVYLDYEDHIQKNAIPTIMITIVFVSCIYCASFPLVVNRLIQAEEDSTKVHDSNKNKEKITIDRRRRFAYQMTNLITNAVLGLLGIYYQYFVLPSTTTTTASSSSLQQQQQQQQQQQAHFKIEGLNDLYVLGAIQIGFQIWAIGIGLSYVNESTPMLLHHVAVIFAASKSVFLTNGFRYYAPLALGMTELSSIPLSVMNSFKTNPHLQTTYPQSYLVSRLIFSICFLIIRIGLFVPQHLEYLYLSFLVTFHAWPVQHIGSFYKGFMSVAWVGAVFLLLLQVYWGYLIVKGLTKFALTKIHTVHPTSTKKAKVI